MRNDQVVEFLSRNAIKHEVRGREAVIDCPSCGKASHCYLSLSTWLWHCKRCDAKGNESSLKVALGLQYEVAKSSNETIGDIGAAQFAADLKHYQKQSDVERWSTDLLKNPAAQLARDYLSMRAIPLAICERYLIGWCSEADGSTAVTHRRKMAGIPSEPVGSGWIVLPAFTSQKNGKPDAASAAVVKLRSVPPAERAFRRLLGGESVLFAPNGVDPASTLLIVGGEIDALSCIVAGFNNVISSTIGEPNWSEGATSQLEAVEDIAIIYDNDEAGRKGAAALAERLGSHRCRIGAWPSDCKDANDALQRLGSNFDVKALVAAAKSAGGDSVVKVQDLRAEYLSELRSGVPRGVSSGWLDLDRLVGGIRWGEVTLVTGDTASGKSTFTSHFALNMAKQGHRVLFCPFELGARRQLAKFVRQDAKAPPDTLSESDLDATLDRLDALPLFLLKRYGTIKLEAMRNTLVHCIKRLGVRFVVIDHLHFMITEGPDERQELDAMMKLFAEIAVDWKVHVVVVAHPRQHHSSNETHRDNRIIQASDLKGSAGLKQLSDNIWSVWRPRKADRSDAQVDEDWSASTLYVLKNRDDYGNEGSVAFRFGLRSATFHAASDNISRRSPGISPTEYIPSEVSTEPRPRRLRMVKAEKQTTPPPTQRHWAETDKDDD